MDPAIAKSLQFRPITKKLDVFSIKGQKNYDIQIESHIY